MPKDRTPDKYIPALSLDKLTFAYDGFMRLTMRESTFRRRLLAQVHIKKGQKVLDLGCGTATLTIMLKQSQPEAEVIGLDGDPKILDMARKKVAKAGVKIELVQGMAFELPYPENYFDHVVSSLVFHHLTRENKKRALAEVFRVLKPGGEFHLLDSGKPSHFYTRLTSTVMRHFEESRDNLEGLLPEFVKEAGFTPVTETARFITFFEELKLYRATKPATRLP